MFFKTTVNDILSDITKKINKLRNLAAELTEDAIEDRKFSDTLLQMAQDKEVESTRAQRIAARLEALLNG